MTYKGEDYIGHTVTAIIVSAFPAVVRVDPSDIWGRLLLALCGGLGAILMIMGDRPKNLKDVAYRITCGIVSCFLFGPYVARRFGYEADLDGIVVVFGMIGASSWYVAGSIARGLSKWQTSGGMWEFIKNRLCALIGIKPEQTPPESEKKES